MLRITQTWFDALVRTHTWTDSVVSVQCESLPAAIAMRRKLYRLRDKSQVAGADALAFSIRGNAVKIQEATLVKIVFSGVTHES